MKTINPISNNNSTISISHLEKQAKEMDTIVDEHLQSIIFAERKKAEIETLMKVIGLVIIIMSLAGSFKFFI